MIRVFLIIMACMEPNFTTCERLASFMLPDPEICQLRRPEAAMAYQLDLPDGWLTFTRCQLVNSEKNGRLG